MKKYILLTATILSLATMNETLASDGTTDLGTEAALPSVVNSPVLQEFFEHYKIERNLEWSDEEVLHHLSGNNGLLVRAHYDDPGRYRTDIWPVQHDKFFPLMQMARDEMKVIEDGKVRIAQAELEQNKLKPKQTLKQYLEGRKAAGEKAILMGACGHMPYYAHSNHMEHHEHVGCFSVEHNGLRIKGEACWQYVCADAQLNLSTQRLPAEYHNAFDEWVLERPFSEPLNDPQTFENARNGLKEGGLLAVDIHDSYKIRYLLRVKDRKNLNFKGKHAYLMQWLSENGFDKVRYEQEIDSPYCPRRRGEMIFATKASAPKLDDGAAGPAS